MDHSATKAAFELLHEMGVRKIHPDPSPMMRALFMTMLWMGPVIGLLYLFGGMKRTLQTGFWAFRIDSKGYIYPNSAICIPFGGCLYTLSQYGRLFCQVTIPLQGSHNSKPDAFPIFSQLGVVDQSPDWLRQLCKVVHPRSSPFQLSIACMFWWVYLRYFSWHLKVCLEAHGTFTYCNTKDGRKVGRNQIDWSAQTAFLAWFACPFPVWAIAYSTPPSAFCLSAQQRAAGSHYRRFIGPRTFNVINISMCVAPFVYSAPITTLIAVRLRKIEKHWLTYNQSHTLLMDLLDQPGTSTEYNRMTSQLEVDIYNDVNTLLGLADKMLTNIRWLAGGYFIVDALFLLFLLIATCQILRPLRTQVRILRDCANRRQGAYHMQSTFQNNKQLSRSSFGGSTIDGKFSPNSPRPTSSLQLSKIQLWVPTFKKGTEVSHAIWSSKLFQDRQMWEMADEAALKQRCLHLNRFTTTTVWQSCQNMLIWLLTYMIQSNHKTKAYLSSLWT